MFSSRVTVFIDAEVVAIAGSSLERSKKFAEEHNISKYYGSYEELVSDPEVGIVYVATLHPEHKKAVLLSLNNKKPVLCEKPLSLNSQDTEEMIKCARDNDVFFMEALWTRYTPAIKQIRDLVSNGEIGIVNGFNAQFGFVANGDTPRLNRKDFGAGALLDIGIYVCSLASMVLGPEYPENVASVGQLNEGGFDDQVGIVLKYKKGIAALHISFLAQLSNSATIIGSKGTITWSPIQCPDRYTIVKDGISKEVRVDLPQSSHVYNFKNSIGLHYEAMYVQESICNGKKESDIQTLDESLNIMKILDKIKEDIGLTY